MKKMRLMTMCACTTIAAFGLSVRADYVLPASITDTWATVPASAATLKWIGRPADWTSGTLPANDGTAVLYLDNPQSSRGWGALYITNSLNVKGLVFKEGYSNNRGTVYRQNASSLTIGSEGVTLVTNNTPLTAAARSTQRGKFPCFGANSVTLAASQTWLMDAYGWGGSAVIDNQADIISGADVQWKLLGRHPYAFRGGSSRNFLGSAYLNVPVLFYGTNQFERLGKRIHFECDAVDGIPSMGNDGGSEWNCNGLFYFFQDKERSQTVTSDIEVNAVGGASKPIAITIDHNDYTTNNCELILAGRISGSYADNSLKFCEGSPSMYSHEKMIGNRTLYPAMDRLVLAGDNSGLQPTKAGARIGIDGIIRAAHANALGTGNAIPLLLGYASRCHILTGVLGADGITVASTMSRNVGIPSGNIPYYIIVGSDGGTCTFTGAISAANPGLLFWAPPNGTAVFTGAVTESTSVHRAKVRGGGVIDLRGTDTFLNGIEIREGTLKVAGQASLGTAAVSLGGIVPSNVYVRAYIPYAPRNDKMSPYGEKNYTISSKTVTGYLGMRFKDQAKADAYRTPDGLKLADGDLVLVHDAFNRPTPQQGGGDRENRMNGVFRVANGGLDWLLIDEFADDDLFKGTYGTRYVVTEGAHRGETYVLQNDRMRSGLPLPFMANFAYEYGFFRESANPAATLTLAAGTYSNAITVENTHSDGVATLKVESGTVTLMGALTLKDDLVIDIAAGAVLHVKGHVQSDVDGVTIRAIGGGTVKIDSHELVNPVFSADASTKLDVGSMALVSVINKSLLHLDANNAGTFSTKNNDGVNLSQWRDARSTISVKANALKPWNDGGGAGSNFGIGQYPKLVDAVGTVSGLKAVDFGELFFRGGGSATANPPTMASNYGKAGTTDAYTLAAGAAFQLSGALNVREVYAVGRDTDDGTQDLNGTSTGKRGMFFGANLSYSRTNFKRGGMSGSGGRLVQTANTTSYDINTGYYNTDSMMVRDGSAILDGVSVAPTASLPDGFHLFGLYGYAYTPHWNKGYPADETNRLADVNTAHVQGIGFNSMAERGGIQVGEWIAFGSDLTATERANLCNGLMKKWFGTRLFLETNSVSCIRLGGGAFSVNGGDAFQPQAIAGRGTLDGAEVRMLDGSVLEVPFAADGTFAGGISVTGAFAFEPGAKIRVTVAERRPKFGRYKIVSATGGITGFGPAVEADLPKGASLSLAADGLYLTISRLGAAVFVR